ncbi:hypothetical protein DOM21_16570 [Bacteriovorax stolpii]|uniref:hypothetical protein n=1 Tax=Bacteriovorax stolpii TaxID=960 RepID=UPI00115964B0|nr:hypothetical protein [Bacteriovorax stolpii]QDK43039.1 hypothetical protein DOM21_16570 [Bacteriovorax stolpii]
MKKLIVLVVVGLIASGCNDYEKIISDARENKANVGRQIIDGEEEPPFPDESENNKTLQGVDVNKNGIRDDVEIWINFVGKDRNHRMALRQEAKKKQLLMNVGGGLSTERRDRVARDVWDAYLCSTFIDWGVKYENTPRFHINSIVFNTNKRIEAYKNFHDRVLVYESNKKDGVSGKEYMLCDFEIENFEKTLLKNQSMGY